MEKVEPQEEHRWLQKLAGNWTYQSETVMGPDAPPVKLTGTETFRSVGGLWFIGEGKCTMPDGSPGEMIMTVGYDTEAKRYTGTWIGSMMTKLWVYDGFIEGNSLHLESKGPSMSGDGTTTTYRDSIELVDDDHRNFTSQVLGNDGNWTRFMTAHYTRIS